MTTQQEALNIAREALQVATTPLAGDRQAVLKAIAAIDSALAQQAAQETQTNELFDWLETEVSAISCWSRGYPSYEHSAYHMREQVMKVLADARKAFAQQAAQQPSDFDAWQANPYTKVLQKSIAEDYVPKHWHDAVLNECMLVESCYVDGDPVKTLQNLIDWHVRTTKTEQQAPAITEQAPPLPEPVEIDWPQLNSNALGCGVEDRGIRDRYEAAEYGWQDGVDNAAERVPEEIYTADQLRERDAMWLAKIAALRSEQASAGEVPAITAEKLLRAVYTRPDLPADARERFFAEFMRSDDDELTLNWGDFRIMAATARALSTPPAVPNYVPLSRDDARLALWQAIESINIGNKTDDKLILAELCKRSIYLCSAAPAAPQGEQPK